MRIPLASFAANYDGEGGSCVIFVEYLDDSQQNGMSIMLGSMFFQSIYAQYTMAGVNSVTVDMYKNLNALSSTYLGSDIIPVGDSPFVVPVAKLEPSINSKNGLPTFEATVSGVTDTNPYYLLDFSSSRTLVWDINCKTTEIGMYPAGACSDAPVLAEMGFDGSPLPGSTGTFSEAKFGGYVVSGTKYRSELCFGDYNCKYVEVYDAETVSQNNWNYNKDGTFGIIGMGPGSFIWEGFVDPETKRSVYSIELARTSNYGLGAAQQSNITFGSANDDAYNGHKNILMPALANYTYGLDSIGFGIVYQTEDYDSSEFFYELNKNYPVYFNTNFKGLGLPANIYSEFVTLASYITAGNITCDNTVDGICVLPGACEEHAAITEYSFKVNFTNTVNDNYMRVPLAGFAETSLQGYGNSVCNIYV